MSGLLILILIFIGVPLLWRWLKPYIFRWAQHRTEDYVRSRMGMPPRDRGGSRSQQWQSYSSSGEYSGEGYSSYSNGNRSRRRGSYSSGPLIPKEYAVDVEYTEIRSYSSEDTDRVRYTVESQVSDAEIIEIRKDR